MCEANLQGIDQILDQEQPAQLLHAGVGVEQDFVGVFTDLVLGQRDLHLQVGPEDNRQHRAMQRPPW